MPINKKSKINNLIAWLHLWLGLTSGIIVLIVSITGCLFSFQKEISDWIYKDTFFVAPPEENANFLPISVLEASAREAIGAKHPINYISTYSAPDKAWEFMAYKTGNPNAITWPGSIDYYESAFVNPYTGAITGKINYVHNFFVIVKYIHWSLFLNSKFGQPIVGWGTMVFVVLLITGFVMWLPKRWNSKEKEKAFKVSWKARWKRLNYDLHNVLGFYVMAIALILGLTGMMYSFRWFNNAVYTVASFSSKAPAYPNFLSNPVIAQDAKQITPMDHALAATKKEFPDATRYFLSVPIAEKAPIAITAYRKKEVYYDYNVAYYDRYSGATLGYSLDQQKNAGEKLLGMKYDIHVGAIGGLPGKIIAFLVSLICASLPVTGFIIWWGRKKKGKKKSASFKHNALEKKDPQSCKALPIS